ncbi:HlyD family secretion protein [Dysgonomonas sp. PFB1-18]|uniref:efflux RND transporter periplasmic adaptor subunit n=1 Tax=unclassified Dysgonomonas TaxID=2630389 RepID=UPI0024739B40|nr:MULTISPECIES: HlyD family efflux transporter periplasmic adaptor subunit [unclassified Dysgonomonas]MDH6309519.1 HlyD family secretion protein [Dysgonomonas sp. PF1-14]MDH6339153.1 HlyD family secretion protein [Dysgonomonas sp. PF1-16]MDH6380561.1 HlyD family secretion protein [Dysgonomonas sp. PFB1-18]MDH6398057.1 HlyD family secretion protein [Dysgonomonas sp. PF1-23]
MDKIIEKKKGLTKKHIPFIAGGAVILLIIGWIIFGNHASKLNVEKEKVTVQDVSKGMFNDYVRINGQVLPINTIHLSAIEGGMVAEKLVEEGSEVSRGQTIISLTNPMLSLNILDSEAQLAEKQNFLRNTQVAMEQEKLNLRKEKLKLDMEVDRKKRKYEQYKQLYSENLTSKEEYLQAKEDYEYAVNDRKLVVERQKQDSIYRGIQISQMEESLHNIRQNLVLVRQRVDNLNVKAPVDGQLGILDVEIGQTVSSGERIGQISVLSDYKVEATIDEHYIDRVKAGLDATFERQDKNFALRVRKVYPEVRDKQFKTDFVFEGERPDNIRAGQTYYINLQLGQPAEAVLIPRGPFYQTTGGQWIFVVTADGDKAVRRNITIGRQNPNYYEVTSGLEPGEKVITSSYDTYGDVQELILK